MFLEAVYVIDGIIGEGFSASDVNGQFIDSLTELEGGKGYWFKVSEPIEFQFILPENRQNSKANRKTN